MPNLIVVIPTYNEADNLPQITEALFALEIPHLQILIIDDNSPDGTGETADQGSTDANGAEDGTEAASAETAQSTTGEEPGKLGDAVPGFQKAPLSADPFDLSDEEIDLLQALAKRRGELEQRERDIDQREAMLAAAESRIEARVSELEELGREIQALLEEHDTKNAEQIMSLVRI